MTLPFSKNDRVEVRVVAASDFRTIGHLRGTVVTCWDTDEHGYIDRAVQVRLDEQRHGQHVYNYPWHWVRKLTLLELVAEAAQ